jgi:hypothetical protein
VETIVAKYDPLRLLLEDYDKPVVIMAFAAIDSAVPGGLPRYARSGDLRWWENEDDQTGRHVQAKAWRAAGYKVWEVDFAVETVEFRKAGLSD